MVAVGRVVTDQMLAVKTLVVVQVRNRRYHFFLEQITRLLWVRVVLRVRLVVILVIPVIIQSLEPLLLRAAVEEQVNLILEVATMVVLVAVVVRLMPQEQAQQIKGSMVGQGVLLRVVGAGVVLAL
jgi:hypothetical protein